MNLKKLKDVENYFFEIYPKGFEDEALQPIIKRHNTEKIGKEVQELFSKDNFGMPQVICDNFAKIISKSSLISLFEKPKVRDMVKQMSLAQKDMFSIALYDLLYEDKKDGFESLVEILALFKLAKWSIVSLIPYYFAREEEFFIKPTTTKNVIGFFELQDIKYKPKPTYEFYVQYKKILNEMKSMVSDKISKNDNAGFTGFLMMGMEQESK